MQIWIIKTASINWVCTCLKKIGRNEFYFIYFNREAQTEKVPEKSKNKISQELEEEKERLKNVRLQIAKKSRAIAGLERQLDEVPSRAELAQYQRRFLELYNQGKFVWFWLFFFLYEFSILFSKNLRIKQFNLKMAYKIIKCLESFMIQIKNVLNY